MFRNIPWVSNRPPENMQDIRTSPGHSGSNSSQEHININRRQSMTIRERRKHLKGSQIKSIAIDTGKDVLAVSKSEARSSEWETSTSNSSSTVSSSCYSPSPTTSANSWAASSYPQYCLTTSMTTPLPIQPGSGRFDVSVTAELRTPPTASSIYSENGSPTPTEATSKPSSPVVTSSRVLEKDLDDYIDSRIRSLVLLVPYWQNDELRGVCKEFDEDLELIFLMKSIVDGWNNIVGVVRKEVLGHNGDSHLEGVIAANRVPLVFAPRDLDTEKRRDEEWSGMDFRDSGCEISDSEYEIVGDWMDPGISSTDSADNIPELNWRDSGYHVGGSL